MLIFCYNCFWWLIFFKEISWYIKAKDTPQTFSPNSPPQGHHSAEVSVSHLTSVFLVLCRNGEGPGSLVCYLQSMGRKESDMTKQLNNNGGNTNTKSKNVNSVLGKIKRKIYVTVVFERNLGLNKHYWKRYFAKSNHCTGHYLLQEKDMNRKY